MEQVKKVCLFGILFMLLSCIIAKADKFTPQSSTVDVSLTTISQGTDSSTSYSLNLEQYNFLSSFWGTITSDDYSSSSYSKHFIRLFFFQKNKKIFQCILIPEKKLDFLVQYEPIRYYIYTLEKILI